MTIINLSASSLSSTTYVQTLASTDTPPTGDADGESGGKACS